MSLTRRMSLKLRRLESLLRQVTANCVCRGGPLRFAAMLLALVHPFFLYGLASAQSIGQRPVCTLENLDACLNADDVDDLLNLLTTARMASEQGRWQDALVALEQADAMVPLGLTRLAIARALFALNRPKEAEQICMELQTDPDLEARGGALELLERIKDRAADPATPPTLPAGPASDTVQDTVISNPGVAGSTNTAREEDIQVSSNQSSELSDSADVLPPTSQRRRTVRLRATAASMGVAAIGLLSAGIWAGLRARDLEQAAIRYDFTADAASRQGQDALGSDASRTAQLANALFIGAGSLGGAGAGIMLGQGRRAPRAALSVGSKGALVTMSWARW